MWVGNSSSGSPSVSVETENGKKWLMLNVVAQILVFMFSVNYRNDDIVWACNIFLIASAYFVAASFHHVRIAQIRGGIVSMGDEDATREWSNAGSSYVAAIISLAGCLWYAGKQQPGPFWTTPEHNVCIDLEQTGWATVVGDTSNTTYCYHSPTLGDEGTGSTLLMIYALFFATLCFDFATYVYMVRFSRVAEIKM